jgi:photosystem II stability/assembly factor-like uncharacterized protein
MKRISHKIKLTTLFIAAFFAVVSAYAAVPWTSLTNGTVEQINSIQVSPDNPNVLYACGDNSVIIKSTDAGALWVAQTSPVVGNDLNSIFTIDADNGFAVGEDGTVIKTVNGGLAWTALTSPTIQDLNDIFFFDLNTGVVVGDNGTIYYTADGGTSWTQNAEGAFPSDFYGLTAAPSNQLFLCGENGIILSSNDKGVHWSTQQDGTKLYDLYDIDCNNESFVVACGSGGTAVFSDNAGAGGYFNMSLTTGNSLNTCDISPNGTVIYIAGDNGFIARSMNDGSSFETASSSQSYSIKNIVFADSQIGYIAGNGGISEKTSTGGATESLYELTLTAPADDDMLIHNSETIIRWTERNVNNVEVYYRLADADEWTLIETVADVDTLIWSVPDTSIKTCKVRLVDADANVADEIQTGNFQIFKPSMRLLSPNGYEHWRNRSNANIVWEGAQDVNVKIEYSIDNGDNWITIKESQPVAPATYTWVVPVNPTDKALVRVSDVNNPLNADTSDINFSIQGVKLESFQSGGEFLFNADYEINWTAVGLTAIDILYSTDDGASWDEVVEKIDTTKSSFTWNIPNTPSQNCRVKLIDPENSQYNDMSANQFTITGVHLTSPTGGETWKAGTTENITWTAADIDKISLKYTTDGGAEWITIHSALDASLGTYSWLVPKVASPTIQIAITDIDAPAVKNISEDFYILNDNGIVVTSPTVDDLWEVDNTYNITWASINVVKVNIDISYDKGNTWERIKSDVSASDNSFAWKLVDTEVTSSTECQIRLTDTENEEVIGLSNGYFRVKNGLFQVPEYWKFSKMTGESSTIIMHDTLNPKIGDIPLQAADVIGFFYEYNENGHVRCAGQGEWQANGTNLAITVWGDNDRTVEKDGYDMNEEYQVKLWDATNGLEYDVYVEYSGDSYFTDNSISRITVFTTHQTQTIKLLPNVWTIFSSNLTPIDPDIKRMMSGIVDKMDFMKNEDGEVYDPENEVDNIKSLNQVHGYKIYMEEEAELEIKGIPALLNKNHISLQAQKWHIISYLPQVSIPVAHALSSISDSNLVLVKNSNGEIYYPAYGINNLTPYDNGVNGSMNPGEGYIICVNRDEKLIYPVDGSTPPDEGSSEENPAPKTNDMQDNMIFSLSYDLKKSENVLQGKNIEYFNTVSEKTGSSAVFVVNAKCLTDGDEVAVISETGRVYGAAYVNNGNAVITVWGDNLSTKDEDGAYENEFLNLKYYSKVESKEKELQVQDLKNGVTGEVITERLKYKENDLLKIVAVEGATVINEEAGNDSFTVYPNPVQNKLTLEVKIDKSDSYYIGIYDLNGRFIEYIYTDLFLNHGSYVFEKNINLQNGSYLIKFQGSERNDIRIIQVVK